MTSISYRRIEEDVADQMGWDPNDLDESQVRQLRRAIGKALDRIWTYTFWNDLLRTRQMTFHPVWAAGTLNRGQIRYHVPSGAYYVVLPASTALEPAALVNGTYQPNLAGWALLGPSSAALYDAAAAYKQGDQVTNPDDGATYQLFAASSTGNAPSNGSYWGVVPDLVHLIPQAGSGQLTIGDVKGVTLNDPKKIPTRAIGFQRHEGGVLVAPSALRPWVQFLPVVPRFTGDNWDPTVAYPAILPEDNFTTTPNP